MRLLHQSVLACLLLLASSLTATVAHAGNHATETQNATKVFWPMMRGESVHDLAMTLYPDSPILRKRFIDKTRSMSHAVLPDLNVKKPFSHAQMIVIPNEHAVRELTHKIKRFQDVKPEEKAGQEPKLHFNYTLNNPPPVPKAVKKPVKNPENKTTPITLPDIKIPEVHVPDIKMPEVSMPKVSMPDIETDQIKTAWHHFWYRLSTGFQNLTHKTGAFLVNIKGDATDFLAKYKGKDIKAVINDYHLRNGALLGLLGLMGVGLLVLSKRHSKEHAQSLDALADTIRPDQASTKQDAADTATNHSERKEPTIEMETITQQAAIPEPELKMSVDDKADTEASDVVDQIPTLNNKTVKVNIDQPEIQEGGSADQLSETVNILVDSAEQLSEIVDEGDHFVTEVALNRPDSSKK